MLRPPPKSTRTDTLFPYPTLFRSILREPRPIQPLGAVSKDVQPAGIQPLHLAVGEISVGVLLQADADDLAGQHLALLHHLADVDVLDRVMTGNELEAAARRGEAGSLQRLLEGVLVGHAAGRLPGREKTVGGVVARVRIERRQ